MAAWADSAARSPRNPHHATGGFSRAGARGQPGRELAGIGPQRRRRLRGLSRLFESAGRNPLDLGPVGATPVDYLRSQAGGPSSTGDLERTILALQGAGVNSRSFAGRNLPAELRSRRSKDGSWLGEVNLTAFAILALRSAGEPRSSLSRSASWLEQAQESNGGWGFQPGSSSDPDSTGAAIQGLAAAGGGAGTVADGVGYLRTDQRSDGGWPLGGNGPSNAQSTAWAIQGLVAARTSPATVGGQGRSGLDYLAARRAPDGHYRYSASSDQTPVWVTGQALLAAEGRAFPLAAVARSSRSRHHAGGSNGHDSGRHSAGGSGGPGGAPPIATGATPDAGYGPAAGGGSTAAHPHDGSTGRRRGRAAQKLSGNVRGRRLFANASPPQLGTPSRIPAADASGSGSHTPRYVGAGILVVALAGLAHLWRRRRAA